MKISELLIPNMPLPPPRKPHKFNYEKREFIKAFVLKKSDGISTTLKGEAAIVIAAKMWDSINNKCKINEEK